MEFKKITQLKPKAFFLLLVLIVLTTNTHAQYVQGSGECGTNYARQYGNNVFEIYQDYGDACVDVYRQNNGGHSVTGFWTSEIGNALIRESDRSNPSMRNYVWAWVDMKIMRGNTYHGLYSWWSNDKTATNGVVEFYVVESYVDKSNPTYDMDYKGWYWSRSGGEYYEIYTREMKNAPSVYGTMDFTQIKCVRARSRTTEGYRGWIGIDPSEHMGAADFILDVNPVDWKLFEISYKMEGYAGNVGGYSEIDFHLDAYFGGSSKNLTESERQNLHPTEEYQVTISPNPSNGEFEIITNREDTTKKIQIFNLNGALVYSTQSKENLIKIESTTLTSGIYLLQTDQNGVISSEKIVIK